jgi:dTDP-4-dehydrorhamnose 3,5-epimerase
VGAVIFRETALGGAFIVDVEPQVDERGFFARTWCQREFAARGLNPRLVQGSLSVSRMVGTLRGLHYQAPPWAEAKLVRCSRGAIYDVVVDLRRESPSYGQWVGVELEASTYRMVYVPEGFAHGFLTLTDDCEVVYQMSEVYVPEAARGIRWNDPTIGISWPGEVRVISPRDARLPFLTEVR